MEERRLWSADHEPDRRPRAADPDRWPARADAPGDGGVRRRGARRLPGPGPPAAAGRAGAAPAAAGHPADGGGRRRPQPARGGDRGTVPGAGRPGGRAERPGERPGVGPAVLRPGGPPGPRAGRRVGGTRPRGGAPGARHPHLPVPPGGGARLAAHPAPRHPRRDRAGQRARGRRAGARPGAPGPRHRTRRPARRRRRGRHRPPARRPPRRPAPGAARWWDDDHGEPMSEAGGRDGSRLTSVRNAARLLKELGSAEGELGVSELSRRLGLGKSTVHRLLATLAAVRILEHDAVSGTYRLGLVVYELGARVSMHRVLHDAATTVLEELRNATKETVQIAVLDGREVVYVER